MATFVLVHPAWFGGWCWTRVAPLLGVRGHDVRRPTLTGLGERAHLAAPGVDLGTHIDDVVNVLTFEDLDDVTLVGSSSSGAVVTAVADRLPERVRHVIYVDAFVPSDGQSVFDLIPPDRRPVMQGLVDEEGDGWLLPRFAAAPWASFVPAAWQVTDEAVLEWVLARLRPTPFGHFREPVRLQHLGGAEPRRTYVRCLGFPHPGFDRHAEHARVSAGWDLVEMSASHLPFLTQPVDLAALLDDLAA